jgi:hypothetical protein
MDGAKCITDTPETLCKECSGKQAYYMRRSFHVSDDGACISDHPGDSRI